MAQNIIEGIRKKQDEHLLSVLREEQVAESRRETMLRGLAPDEKARLENVFGKERAEASERIMALAARNQHQLADRMSSGNVAPHRLFLAAEAELVRALSIVSSSSSSPLSIKTRAIFSQARRISSQIAPEAASSNLETGPSSSEESAERPRTIPSVLPSVSFTTERRSSGDEAAASSESRATSQRLSLRDRATAFVLDALWCGRGQGSQEVAEAAWEGHAGSAGSGSDGELRQCRLRFLCGLCLVVVYALASMINLIVAAAGGGDASMLAHANVAMLVV
ncbi:hypothetical protein T484DRAFT_1915269 [Baffinella frigidus]|nr:hypothetical protein T484DRAFT_1915269 [Cryptophyta sp. CCMP2293]